MRRTLFVLIFIICAVVYLFPEYPTQARPMLTVPAGTPRPRKIPTPIAAATPIVDSGQWIVDSERGGGSLGGGVGGRQLSPATNSQQPTTSNQQPNVNYQLSTIHSIRPIFAMQGEEVVLSVTVHYDEEAWAGEDDPPVAEQVIVSQELPESLDLVGVTDPQKVGYRSGISDEGSTFFIFSWPSLAPGESVTAEATLRVAQDAPSGAAISFLSVTQADQSAPQTHVIRLGTPPDELPDFENW